MGSLMFAIGFLIIGAIFIGCLLLASKLLPERWRHPFVLGVLAVISTYPFLHLVRPSYKTFKELCQHQRPPTIIKTKAVDFILLEWGYLSDCTGGPAYIANSGYLGFDCRTNAVDKEAVALYRYTKKPDSDSNCGLECFDVEKILKPETSFGYFDHSSRTRAGYMVGDEKRVTIDYPAMRSEEHIPFWRWLRFDDYILVDAADGDMAFTTRYSYLPYGPLTILGLASGSAPAEQCPWPPKVNPRDVYKPKHPPAVERKP